jgi:hypothetical protein
MFIGASLRIRVKSSLKARPRSVIPSRRLKYFNSRDRLVTSDSFKLLMNCPRIKQHKVSQKRGILSDNLFIKDVFFIKFLSW